MGKLPYLCAMKINRDLDIDLTPEELSQLFWDMDSDRQAVFFAHLLRISGKALLEKQMDSMSYSRLYCKETDECIRIIRESTIA